MWRHYDILWRYYHALDAVCVAGTPTKAHVKHINYSHIKTHVPIYFISISGEWYDTKFRKFHSIVIIFNTAVFIRNTPSVNHYNDVIKGAIASPASHYLLNRLFRRRSTKSSKFRVTGLCAGNSPGTGEFPAQMAGNAENVSIWWRHHDILMPQ